MAAVSGFRTRNGKREKGNQVNKLCESHVIKDAGGQIVFDKDEVQPPAGSASFVPDDDETPKDCDQNNEENEEAVAGHAFLVAERSQSLDAARGEIVYEFRVVGSWTPEMCRPTLP